EATAIPLTWRLFGNAGVVGYEDRPVTESFTRSAPAVLHWPWRAHLFKTLYRNDGSYGKLGVHRPRKPDPARKPRWFDGSGRELPAVYHGGRIFSAVGQDHGRLVQLNHYPLGAVESYVLKCDRGRAVHEADRLGMDYWVERNFCAVEDRTILGLDSRALREELHADPVLGALHRAAVDWRRARLAALMSEEPWRALYGRLLMAGPSRILSQAEAETVWRPWTGGNSTRG
ncbi:MAG: glycosyltransferase family 2 protein, partial [Paracoccaceae bacterium]|nr:glycosyltransferase family 2 protein [Paracoccaceae bacterium]